MLKSGEKVVGDAVIAADGAYSPIKRALKIDSEYNGYSAIAPNDNATIAARPSGAPNNSTVAPNAVPR